MNMLDYIIIGFLLYLLIRGIIRGFVREISSLAGVVLGIWLGNLYQPWMTGILKKYLPMTQYLPLLSFITLFFAVIVVCNIIGWFLTFLPKKPFLGGADMTLGAVLALLKGIIITYLAIIMLTFYLPGKAPLIANSTLAPWIVKSYQAVTGLVSPGHYKNWKDKVVGGSKKIGDNVAGKIKDLVKDDE